MLKLYIANRNYSSWSLRPWVLMRELGIPFEEVLVRFGGDGPGASFRVFSPTGKVPCLVDGGRTVWDSLAITEYLAEQTPGVWPADPSARAWSRCVAAEMHSGFNDLRNTCTMNCGLRVRLPSIGPGLRAYLDRIDELWTQGVSTFGGPFLAGGAFSAVDAFFAPVAFRIQTYAPPLSVPALDYAARLRALPSMKAWYAAALAEPWRDAAHEAVVREVGTCIADFRTPERAEASRAS